MAPIPENNRDNPPDGNKDGSEIGHFSNPNLVFPIGESDSSDDDNEDNLAAPSGYSLLPQEPGDASEDDSDDDNGNFEHIHQTEDVGDGSQQVSDVTNTSAVEGSNVASNLLPEAVIASEAGAAAPTVSISSESSHPAFLAKFPDGKIPSYMQVPSLPQDVDSHLWNQQRQDTHKFSMDSAQESKILRAMAGFSLPSESIPDWARNLPEEQWRQQVVNRIAPLPSTGGSTGVSAVKQWEQASAEEKVANGQGTVSTGDSSWVAEFPESKTSK